VTRNPDYAGAVRELERAQRIILTTHVKPDGDGLGSIAALRRWLLSRGKTVEVVVPTPPPVRYGFLDPDRAVRTARRDVDPKALPPADLVCLVDTGTWQQLAGVEPLVNHASTPVLLIDHHLTHDDLADCLLVDPEAAATAVLVYHLLRAAGAAVDARTARDLFVGLATDTDWFRLPNVDAETLRLAAALVEAGARPCDIYDQLYLNEDMPRVQLRGRAIETLRCRLDGRATVMRLTRALFRELGADIGDTENLINECLRVRGTQVGIMLVETDGEEIRVSWRSRPGVNVLEVAERFGGGGHVRAAGARIKGSIDQVEAQVLAAVAQALAGTQPTP
jgi:phosphoesterase RecJ-like protein